MENTITVNGVEYVRADTVSVPAQTLDEMPYVIIRADRADVQRLLRERNAAEDERETAIVERDVARAELRDTLRNVKALLPLVFESSAAYDKISVMLE